MEITITKVAIINGLFPRVSYTEHLPDNDERKHPNVTCTSPAHKDLINVFAAFKPHLALICEEITVEQFIEAIPNEYDATQPHIIEMGEMVPAIKAVRGRKKKDKDTTISMIGADGTEKDITGLFDNLEESAQPKRVKTLMDHFQISTVEFKSTNGIGSMVLNGERELSNLKWIGCGPTYAIKDNDPEYKHISDLFQLGELLRYEMSQYIINHKYAPPIDPELPFGDGVGIEEEQY